MCVCGDVCVCTRTQDGYEKMMHELAEDRVKMEAKMEDLFIKEDEERRVEWEKEEKELLANAIERKVGEFSKYSLRTVTAASK